MTAKAVDKTRAGRSAAVTEEMHERVDSLLVVGMEAIRSVHDDLHIARKDSLPEHGWIRHVVPRVTLVRPVHGRELDGISDEKDGLEKSASCRNVREKDGIRCR
jgi:hypothetical protein